MSTVIFRSLPKIFLAFCLMGVTSQVQANSKEVELARGFVTKLLKLGKLSKKYDDKSKADAKVIVKELSDGVDFSGLAAKSLHTTWDNMKQAKRDDFMETLQGMIEEVLFPRAHKISAPLNEIEFSLHPKNPKRVKAKTRFETEKHGEIIEKDLEIDLIYNGKGLITDAWIEGELVSQNLQRQFDNALKKKSFDQILAQMKSKLKKTREPEADDELDAKAEVESDPKVDPSAKVASKSKVSVKAESKSDKDDSENK